MIKVKKFNFYKDFFEKDLIPPFYHKIYNKVNSEYFLNQNKSETSLNVKGTYVVNFIPPFFKTKPDKFDDDCRIVSTHDSFLIDLHNFDNLKEYLGFQFGTKSRSTLNRRIKKLEKCFNVSYKMYHGEINKVTYDYLFDQLKIMIQKRFAQRGVRHSSIANWHFYEESVYPLILSKKASLFVIYNDQQPMAICVNFLQQGIFDYAIPSYSLDYSRFGLGNIVILKQLEWCFNNNYNILSMGWGDLRYKREWCNSIYKYQSHILYKKNDLKSKLKAILISNLIQLKLFVKQRIDKEFLKKVNILKRIANKKTLPNPVQKSFKKLVSEELQSLILNKKISKLNINTEEYMFLRKPVYDFQYYNSENTKDIKVSMVSQNSDNHVFIIQGKNHIGLLS